ncbi:MAG: recombination associated protein RdgC [Myxococcota bacterium]|jgi:recombination associated protein RdgC
MGAAKGTLTYTTYYVLDEPGPGFRERFMGVIQKHAFRDIDIDAGKDRSMGWVALDEPFDTELSWGKVFRDPYVCLSLREDTIKVPKTVFQVHYDKRERDFLAEQGRDSLKKSERSALKEDVMVHLRRRALPDIKAIDVVWNTVDGSLRLWTQSKRTRESFEEIVAESWGLRIVPNSPYTMMLARATDPETAVRLLDIEPADLIGVAA